MSRHNDKVTLSQHRWERIRMMSGNIHGYMYTFANGIPIRSKAFFRGNHVYGLAVGKSGQLLFVRYDVGCYNDYWAFRVDDSCSPHSPF